jgi:hypothetical protein
MDPSFRFFFQLLFHETLHGFFAGQFELICRDKKTVIASFPRFGKPSRHFSKDWKLFTRFLQGLEEQTPRSCRFLWAFLFHISRSLGHRVFGNLFFKPFSSKKSGLVLAEALRYILLLSGKFVITGSGCSHPSGGQSCGKGMV